MSINKASFKGYNRGLYRHVIVTEIFFDEYDWNDDGNYYYDYYDDRDYDYGWEDEYQCFLDREYDKELEIWMLEEMEFEFMRCDYE